MTRRPIPTCRLIAALLLTLTLAAAPALAAADATLTVTKPEQVGLSSERLARIDAAMNGYVEAGKIAGATGLIARRRGIPGFNTHR